MDTTMELILNNQMNEKMKGLAERWIKLDNAIYAQFSKLDRDSGDMYDKAEPWEEEEAKTQLEITEQDDKDMILKRKSLI